MCDLRKNQRKHKPNDRRLRRHAKSKGEQAGIRDIESYCHRAPFLFSHSLMPMQKMDGCLLREQCGRKLSSQVANPND